MSPATEPPRIFRQAVPQLMFDVSWNDGIQSALGRTLLRLMLKHPLCVHCFQLEQR